MSKKQITLHNLKTKAIKGVSVLIVREFFLKVLAIVGQILLVRILLPEYFGIFALISFIISVAELITDLGVTQAIIQSKKELTSQELSSVFFLKLLFTLLVFVILYFLIPFITLIFQGFNSSHFLMIRVFSIVLLFKPLRSILTGLMERKLEYNHISAIDLVGIFIYYLLSYLLALYNFAVWSFIWAVLFKEIVELVLATYYMHWVPQFYFNIHKIKKIIIYGIYIQLGSILGFVHRATIPAIAGVNSSPSSVGLLDWSSNVASIPRALSDNFGRVAFASFSKIQDNKDLIAKSIEKSFCLLSIVSIFFIIVTFGFGKELIQYFLTDKWFPALPVLYIFVGATYFLNATTVIGHAILALGKTKIMFISSVILISFEWILSYLLLLKLGFIGIAIGSFVGIIFMLLALLLISYHFGIIINLKKTFLPGWYVFIVMVLVVFFINTILPISFFFLLFKITITFCIYIVVYFCISKSTLKEFVFLLLNLSNKKNENLTKILQ